MQLFENIANKLSQDSRSIQKIMIGGILGFIPIVNFLVLGYLYRFAVNVKMKRMQLPQWNEWRYMMIEMLRFLSVLFIYTLIPVFVAWLISEALRYLSLNFLGVFGYFPLSIALIITPGLTMVALYHFCEGASLPLLFNVQYYFKLYGRSWKRLLIPTFVFFGIISVGLPFYGISFFIALIGLIAYSFSVLSSIYLKEEGEKRYADI